MVTEKNLFNTLIDIFIIIVLAAITISCVLPFFHVVSLSMSSRVAIAADEVAILPIGANFDNYAAILQNPDIIRAFVISVVRVVMGIVVTLMIVIVTAYPLSLDQIRMPGRNVFKVVMIFALLFNGGLIPTFLAYQNLGLVNNFMVLILPLAINTFYIILAINFFRGIPRELSEAAWLDGASHFDVLFRIYVPISKPSMATIALFAAVTHWNSWFDAAIYIRDTSDWPLQTWLYSLVTTRQVNWDNARGVQDYLNSTPEGLSAALIVIASVPIMLVYPFLQRYFVTGLTLGSVKE